MQKQEKTLSIARCDPKQNKTKKTFNIYLQICFCSIKAVNHSFNQTVLLSIFFLNHSFWNPALLFKVWTEDLFATTVSSFPFCGKQYVIAFRENVKWDMIYQTTLKTKGEKDVEQELNCAGSMYVASPVSECWQFMHWFMPWYSWLIKRARNVQYLARYLAIMEQQQIPTFPLSPSMVGSYRDYRSRLSAEVRQISPYNILTI